VVLCHADGAAIPVNQSFQMTQVTPAVISVLTGSGQSATVGTAFTLVERG